VNGILITTLTGRAAAVTSAADQASATIAYPSSLIVLASCSGSPHNAVSQDRLRMLSGKEEQR